MSGVGAQAVKNISKAVPRRTLRQKIWEAMCAWQIRNSGYQELGLFRDDLYNEDSPVFAEAVRRLPEKESNLRIYRIRRALDLSMKHRILPREQWTKPEEEVFYLQPIIEEVKKEMEDRKKWDTM